MIMGTTLEHGEYSKIEFIKDSLIFSAKDHARARSTERFVSSSGNNISIVKRIVEFLSSHETTDVSHISKEIGTNLIANISESLVVKITRISRETSNNNLRLEL